MATSGSRFELNFLVAEMLIHHVKCYSVKRNPTQVMMVLSRYATANKLANNEPATAVHFQFILAACPQSSSKQPEKHHTRKNEL